MEITDRKKTLTLGVIGAYGHLGKRVIIDAMHQDCIETISLYGRDPNKTDFLCKDLSHGFPDKRDKLVPCTRLDSSELLDSDFLIIAIKGKYKLALKPHQRRKGKFNKRNKKVAYMKDRKNMVDLSRRINGYQGFVINTVFPMELTCEDIVETGEIPENRVTGASFIDTVRLEQKLIEEYEKHYEGKLTRKDLKRAIVIATHDENGVIPYSQMKIDGTPFSEYEELNNPNVRREITNFVKYWAQRGIIKGEITRYGPASAITQTIKALRTRKEIPICVQDPETCLFYTWPVKLSKEGELERQPLDLKGKEKYLFDAAIKSLETLKKWKKTKFD